MITILAAGAFAPAMLDKWELKPDLAAKATASYAITVNVDMQGQQHEAKLTMIRLVESADAKQAKVKYTWKDIMLDDQPIGEDRDFPLTVTPRNAILSSTGEFLDDERRMLSVVSFVYPETTVDVGDKWTFENKPEKGAAHTSTFEVKAVEKLGELDVMKVAFKLDEKDESGMHADGFFWVSKDGKVQKWQHTVKNWVVPMAGAGAMTVTLKGELKKT